MLHQGDYAVFRVCAHDGVDLQVNQGSPGFDDLRSFGDMSLGGRMDRGVSQITLTELFKVERVALGI